MSLLETKRFEAIGAIAAKVARDVFEVGDENGENGETCRRIQFKLGNYPDRERDAGGLCEASLENVVATSLRNQFADAPRRLIDLLGFDPTNHHNAAKCPYCSRED